MNNLVVGILLGRRRNLETRESIRNALIGEAISSGNSGTSIITMELLNRRSQDARNARDGQNNPPVQPPPQGGGAPAPAMDIFRELERVKRKEKGVDDAQAEVDNRRDVLHAAQDAAQKGTCKKIPDAVTQASSAFHKALGDLKVAQDELSKALKDLAKLIVPGP